MTAPPPISAEQEDWIGREVGGKYRIESLLGRGGMGAVYEAENLTLGKQVALKFIDVESARNSDGVKRFVREARAASAIESAHIVQVFDVGELDDGRPYIVMELLRGENLGARLQRLGRLSVAETVHLAVQCLRGLHRAHENGIVHRDLKPENVLLVETDDDPMFVKIVDFGISKITRRSKTLDPGTITQEGVVLGTPFYMAPEQAQALTDLDGRADLWSLGAIMYECLAGRRPFAGDTYEQVIIAICTKPAEDLRTACPAVPPALADVVMQALSQERDKRFDHAKAFLGALKAATPELVNDVPPSFEPTLAKRGVQGGAEQDGSPRTGVAWSSAEVEAAVPRDESALRKSRTKRLALLGGAVALVAFVATLGAASLLESPVEDPRELRSAAPSAHAAPLLTVRVDSNVPDAQIVIDGELSSNAVLHGRRGETRVVRISADGFTPQERRVTLGETGPVLHVELEAAAAAPSAPIPAASSSRRAVPPPLPPSTSTRKPESGSLTGGLELKKDLP